MISGRSLGHTGGTLDKLETIPGFNTQLSFPEMRDVLKQCGAALIGQTPTIVPADRILYALRDHTGTVESPFLITASIMSKKLAEGLNALVLDVKVGSGAFMPTYEKSKLLAELMVETGEASGTTHRRSPHHHGRASRPLLRQLGRGMGVRRHHEAAPPPHVRRSHRASPTFSPAGCSTSPAVPPHPKKEQSSPTKFSAAEPPIKAWLKIVAAQSGDTSLFEDPAAHHTPTATRTLTAPTSGYLAAMDCKQVGWAVQRLGAGRC